MTKKKHETAEDIKKSEAGEIIDNMDINSKDKSNIVEELKDTGEEVTLQTPEDLSGDKEKSEPDSTAKEAAKDDIMIAKLAEMQDKYLRLSAEFDNYRKRTLREKIEITRHAGENILISIIPVMDDFERALKLMDASTADSLAIKTGIDLIYNKFRDFLIQNGIKEIESLHSDFDVDLHEAVSKIPVEDENLKGKVVEVLQKGYFLHEKVLRFSKVVVGE
jgi:molecular chaperone GrpE